MSTPVYTVRCPGISSQGTYFIARASQTYGGAFTINGVVENIVYFPIAQIGCQDGNGGLIWSSGVEFTNDTANSLDKYTPGTRPEVIKVATQIEGMQQIANQVASAADWAIAASLLFAFFFGYYCGGRSASPPAGTGYSA